MCHHVRLTPQYDHSVIDSYKICSLLGRYYFLRHVVETTNPKVPGEVRDSDGVGNDAFDAGQLTAFAYPVVGLFKLKFPIGRVELRERFATKSPQGFCYVNKQMLDEVPSSGMERLF